MSFFLSKSCSQCRPNDQKKTDTNYDKNEISKLFEEDARSKGHNLSEIAVQLSDMKQTRNCAKKFFGVPCS